MIQKYFQTTFDLSRFTAGFNQCETSAERIHFLNQQPVSAFLQQHCELWIDTARQTLTAVEAEENQDQISAVEIADLKGNLARGYLVRQDYEPALQLLFDVHAQYIIEREPLRDAICLHYLGVGYSLLGDYRSSFDYYLDAIEKARILRAPVLLAELYAELGADYGERDLLAEACDYLEQSLSILAQQDMPDLDEQRFLIMTQLITYRLKMGALGQASDDLARAKEILGTQQDSGPARFHYQLLLMRFAALSGDAPQYQAEYDLARGLLSDDDGQLDRFVFDQAVIEDEIIRGNDTAALEKLMALVLARSQTSETGFLLHCYDLLIELAESTGRVEHLRDWNEIRNQLQARLIERSTHHQEIVRRLVVLQNNVDVLIEDLNAYRADDKPSRRITDRLRGNKAYDDQTGLLNREGALLRLERIMKEACGMSYDCALLRVSMGAARDECGDWDASLTEPLVKAFSDRLWRSFRSTDLVARIGPDQFLVLLRKVDRGLTRVLLRRLLSTLSKPFPIGESQFTVDVSIGAVLVHPEQDHQALEIHQLLAQAEAALQRAVDDPGRSCDFDLSDDSPEGD